jgi:glycosyltransferase involved in cell wall biosynthesis
MGNYFPFHGEIYSYLEYFPGVVILHDLVLHGFFQNALVQGNQIPQYLSLIERWYGSEGRARAGLAFEGKAPPLWDTDQMSRYPLFEPAIANAFGVVTHSDWALERIRQVYQGPVEKIFLAYNCPRQKGKQSVPRDSSRLLALSVGLVQPSKRIASVIHVLGQNPDIARTIEYVVVGSTKDSIYFNECRLLVEKYGLEDCVRFVGHATDAVLYSYLDEADICLNLRFPTTESGSAALAEGMLAGKPIIALNVGCCCDIPDDCIVRIDVANEQVELAHALRQLMADGNARGTVGRNARCFADRHFTANAYIAKLLPFLDRVRNGAPLMRSVDRMRAVLQEMEITPQMLISRTVAETFHELFCQDDTVRFPG